MSAGRERGVTVWEARETLLLQRLEEVEQDLRRLAEIEEPQNRKRLEQTDALAAERLRLRAMLAQLGPSPRAKMG